MRIPKPKWIDKDTARAIFMHKGHRCVLEVSRLFSKYLPGVSLMVYNKKGEKYYMPNVTGKLGQQFLVAMQKWKEKGTFNKRTPDLAFVGMPHTVMRRVLDATIKGKGVRLV
jgi:hypothetical protein